MMNRPATVKKLTLLLWKNSFKIKNRNCKFEDQKNVEILACFIDLGREAELVEIQQGSQILTSSNIDKNFEIWILFQK